MEIEDLREVLRELRASSVYGIQICRILSMKILFIGKVEIGNVINYPLICHEQEGYFSLLSLKVLAGVFVSFDACRQGHFSLAITCRQQFVILYHHQQLVIMQH